MHEAFSRDLAAIILIVGSRWKLVIRFTCLPLYRRRDSRPFPSNWRLDALHSRCELLEEERNCRSCWQSYHNSSQEIPHDLCNAKFYFSVSYCWLVADARVLFSLNPKMIVVTRLVFRRMFSAVFRFSPPSYFSHQCAIFIHLYRCRQSEQYR